MKYIIISIEHWLLFLSVFSLSLFYPAPKMKQSFCDEYAKHSHNIYESISDFVYDDHVCCVAAFFRLQAPCPWNVYSFFRIAVQIYSTKKTNTSTHFCSNCCASVCFIPFHFILSLSKSFIRVYLHT